MVSVTTTHSGGAIRTIGGCPTHSRLLRMCGQARRQAAIVQPPHTGYNNIVVALHLEPQGSIPMENENG
jgi:hypothetical protein